MQPNFARGLPRAAKEVGIDTAMESMGFAEYETIASILLYLDVYLMDIKHINPSKHAEYTGKSNELMQENARKIASSRQTELIIRVPTIPGFNDTKEEILEIARFADSLPGVRQIHLLPYHSFGRGKYEGLGRDCPMGEAVTPSHEEMRQFKEAVEQNTALQCQIGG